MFLSRNIATWQCSTSYCPANKNLPEKQRCPGHGLASHIAGSISNWERLSRAQTSSLCTPATPSQHQRASEHPYARVEQHPSTVNRTPHQCNEMKMSSLFQRRRWLHEVLILWLFRWTVVLNSDWNSYTVIVTLVVTCLPNSTLNFLSNVIYWTIHIFFR